MLVQNNLCYKVSIKPQGANKHTSQLNLLYSNILVQVNHHLPERKRKEM